MSRLATTFQPAGSTGLQPPLPYNQIIQNRPLQQQAPQQLHVVNILTGSHMPINPTALSVFKSSTSPTVTGAIAQAPFDSNLMIGMNGFASQIGSADNPKTTASIGSVRTTYDHSNNNNKNNRDSGSNKTVDKNNAIDINTKRSSSVSSSTSAANVSQMSKLLKNIPPHLHEIHLIHLKDCKVRKFIPNKAKPEHPSHPLYHEFLEQLLQKKDRLLNHSHRKAGQSNRSGIICFCRAFRS